jgi:hypothetical protein
MDINIYDYDELGRYRILSGSFVFCRLLNACWSAHVQ